MEAYWNTIKKYSFYCLILSLASNVYLFRENAYLFTENVSVKQELSEKATTESELMFIGTELYKMRQTLRFPSKIVESLLPEIVRFESRNNYLATGDGGKSHGAAQIQLPTAEDILKNRDLTVEDLYNPYVNPFLASEHLEYLYGKYRNVRYTLSAYNGGLKKVGGKVVGMSNHSTYVDPILKKTNVKPSN